MNAELDVLRLVQDVDWVVGSFVANRNGELLVYQMPPEFGEAELGRTTTRLASIVRSAELCGVDVEQCDFSFSRYQLVISRCSAGMLCVLVEAPVSRPALNMATRLALSQLPALISEIEAQREPSALEALPQCELNVAPLEWPLEHFGITESRHLPRS
jgi:hypothetical protein